MLIAGCLGIKVIAKSKALKAVRELLMIMITYFLWGTVFRLGSDRNRSSVTVAS